MQRSNARLEFGSETGNNGPSSLISGSTAGCCGRGASAGYEFY